MKNIPLHQKCTKLIDAFRSGTLGQTKMPEDAHPRFRSTDTELQIAYFTLPMALNYQRDSYKLWEAALETYSDPKTNFVFDVAKVSKASDEELRGALVKYKVALQPNKHIHTWKTISKTIYEQWGSWERFFESTEYDFLKLIFTW